MKILQIADPRTGSKALFSNLHRYVEAVRLSNEYPIPTAWFYEPNYGKKFTAVNKQIQHTDDESINNIYQIISDRLPHIDSLDYTVAKFHPYTAREEDLRELVSKFDYVIQSKRKSVYQQCLSRCVATKANNWKPGIEQAALAQQMLIEPFIVDLDRWIAQCDRTIDGFIFELGGAHPIFVDDLKEVLDAETFCSMLKLPFCEFYIEPNAIEYGNEKESMIINIDEVKSIYCERANYWKTFTNNSCDLLFGM